METTHHGRDSFTKQESVPSTSNSLRLTLCQNADGSFPADTTTATILGLDLHKLMETGKPEDPLVWATILCLLYLEENCRAERESWELVAEKAIKWLDCRGVGMGGQLEQRARRQAADQRGIARGFIYLILISTNIYLRIETIKLELLNLSYLSVSSIITRIEGKADHSGAAQNGIKRDQIGCRLQIAKVATSHSQLVTRICHNILILYII